MNNRIPCLLLAVLLLAIPFSSAWAQNDAQYDGLLTDAIVSAMEFDTLDDLIAFYGFIGQPMAVVLNVRTTGDNGNRAQDEDAFQEGALHFENGAVAVRLTLAEADPLLAMLDAVFPQDYFAKLPGPYSWKGIRYENDKESQVRRLAYFVRSTELAVGTYDDLQAFADVIDLKDYITATIDDGVSAHVEGHYEGGTVIINSEFDAAGVLTAVTLIP